MCASRVSMAHRPSSSTRRVRISGSGARLSTSTPSRAAAASITRRRGGFVLATMAATKTDLTDARYAMRAVEDLAGLFGKPPRAYAYDRAGYSTENVKLLRKLGVREVGVWPTRGAWSEPHQAASGRVAQKQGIALAL